MQPGPDQAVRGERPSEEITELVRAINYAQQSTLLQLKGVSPHDMLKAARPRETATQPPRDHILAYNAVKRSLGRLFLQLADAQPPLSRTEAATGEPERPAETPWADGYPPAEVTTIIECGSPALRVIAEATRSHEVSDWWDNEPEETKSQAAEVAKGLARAAIQTALARSVKSHACEPPCTPKYSDIVYEEGTPAFTRSALPPFWACWTAKVTVKGRCSIWCTR